MPPAYIDIRGYGAAVRVIRRTMVTRDRRRQQAGMGAAVDDTGKRRVRDEVTKELQSEHSQLSGVHQRVPSAGRSRRGDFL
ncbi:hypothetical protein ABFA25_03655 [Mycobacterium lepromatosis]|uniref:hypothetical protein n=1 Tax=Mycobacterium lepromatosis TaxID=480418 RepID=UPI003D801F97